ncbi:MAG: TlyA family RNA methyltransferase [Leptonema sp. (in: bacteria)]
MIRSKKERIDKLMVLKNIVESREKAQSLILSGVVFVNQQKVEKSNIKIPIDATVEIKQKEKYVSRGGYKIEKGLKKFQIVLEDRICLDIGSSTGGFTDCMLQFGAKKVYAIDVGKNQLHESLRNHPKVISIEKFNARYINNTIIPEKIDFFASDVSFISQTKIIPNLHSILGENSKGILLIKPQFELSKQEIKNGVVRDPHLHIKAISFVYDSLLKSNFSILGLDYSPIKGPKGNIEFLMLVINARLKSITKEEIDSIVEEAHKNLA